MSNCTIAFLPANHTPTDEMEMEMFALGVATRLMTIAEFAATKHASQRRSDGMDIPYINHPLGVARIVAIHATKAKQMSAENVIAAALLHDTLEDTKTTYAELVALAGDEVAGFVQEVTDDKTLPKSERKRQQIVHASTMTDGAKLVKLADKLYNLRDLLTSQPTHWSVEYIQGYFLWSKTVVEAMRGIWPTLDAELDDVFTAQFFHKSTQRHYPVLPDGADRDPQKCLEEYYALCK